MERQDEGDPGLDRALRPVAVSDHALTPVRQAQALHRGQEGFGFRFHRLGQQSPGAAAQNLGQRVVDLAGLMHEAALKADEDPDRLSFSHAVRVVRRKLVLFAALPPSGQTCPA